MNDDDNFTTQDCKLSMPPPFTSSARDGPSRRHVAAPPLAPASTAHACRWHFDRSSLGPLRIGHALMLPPSPRPVLPHETPPAETAATMLAISTSSLRSEITRSSSGSGAGCLATAAAERPLLLAPSATRSPFALPPRVPLEPAPRMPACKGIGAPRNARSCEGALAGPFCLAASAPSSSVAEISSFRSVMSQWSRQRVEQLGVVWVPKSLCAGEKLEQNAM
mmetsp:Transcript_14655/g.37194  ORF Transcript_14655/g.37194 Transcript_14655/m.37194 type:complete len:222 (-) Transcript_14655:2775-3440(-)